MKRLLGILCALAVLVASVAAVPFSVNAAEFQNPVVNGDFENGTTGWSPNTPGWGNWFVVDASQPFVEPVNGEEKDFSWLENDTNVAWLWADTRWLRQDGISLEDGKTYTLLFRLASDKENSKQIDVRLMTNDPDNGHVGDIKPIDSVMIQPEYGAMKTQHITFTATYTGTYLLALMTNGNNCGAFFDDIMIVEGEVTNYPGAPEEPEDPQDPGDPEEPEDPEEPIVTNNPVVNGDFENGTTGWTPNTPGWGHWFVVDASKPFVEPVNGEEKDFSWLENDTNVAWLWADTRWLRQDGISLEDGKTYTLLFRLAADKENSKQIDVRLMTNDPDNGHVGDIKPIDSVMIQPEYGAMKTQHITFTATYTGTYLLALMTNGNNCGAFFDDIMIVEGEVTNYPGAPEEPGDPEEPEDPEEPIVTNNPVVNGDFENGTDTWSLRTPGWGNWFVVDASQPFVEPVNGEEKDFSWLENDTNVAWLWADTRWLRQDGIFLEGDKTYTLMFKLAADKSNAKPLEVRLRTNDPDNGHVDDIKPIDGTTVQPEYGAMKTQYITFTTTYEGIYYLTFMTMGNNCGTYFDDIVIAEGEIKPSDPQDPEDPEEPGTSDGLVGNGDFEDGTDVWDIKSPGWGTFKVVNAAEPETPDEDKQFAFLGNSTNVCWVWADARWLRQDGIRLEADTTYVLSFKLAADKANSKEIEVRLRTNDPDNGHVDDLKPIDGYFVQPEYGAMKTYTYEFTTTYAGLYYLTFMVTGNTCGTYFDDIIIREPLVYTAEISDTDSVYDYDGCLFIPNGITLEELVGKFILENAELASNVEGVLKTGDTVKVICQNEDIISWTIVVLGDLNGDGKISMLDILRVKKYISEIVEPSKAQLFAACINGDDDITEEDIISLMQMVFETNR